MKILILNALKDWIISKFGAGHWKKIAEASGVGVDNFHQQDAYMSDTRFSGLIQAVLMECHMAEEELKESFIRDYWQTTFAPKVLMSYTRKIESTKVFLTNIIKLNNELYRLIPNTYLFKIELQEMSETSITLIYPNEKALIDVVALLRGASSIFHDTYTVKKINAHSTEIKFDRK